MMESWWRNTGMARSQLAYVPHRLSAKWARLQRQETIPYFLRPAEDSNPDPLYWESNTVYYDRPPGVVREQVCEPILGSIFFYFLPRFCTQSLEHNPKSIKWKKSWFGNWKLTESTILYVSARRQTPITVPLPASIAIKIMYDKYLTVVWHLRIMKERKHLSDIQQHFTQFLFCLKVTNTHYWNPTTPDLWRDSFHHFPLWTFQPNTEQHTTSHQL